MMTYEAWRITYQSSEQAARAAYAALEQRDAEIERLRAALASVAEREWIDWPGTPELHVATCIARRALKDMPEDHPVRRWYEAGRKPDDPAWPDPGSQVVS